MSSKVSKPKEAVPERSGRLINRSVIRALIPMAPVSPVKRPVRSGPYQRKNGLEVLIDADPVFSSLPLPSTTSNESTDSADRPWLPVPMLAEFCEVDPPTVAFRPENGPQNGVRSFSLASAALSLSQVTAGSTVTYMSVALISTMRLRREVSTSSDCDVTGR